MDTLLWMFFGVLPVISGHGRMRTPPSRASMWRDGYRQNGINYDDNQLFCGGFHHQQSLGGACGICGDPYDASPKEHEAGGSFANGIITGTYQQGGVLSVSIEITAHHKGYFEFRLCAHNDPSTAATQECLDTHLLTLLNHYPGSTRYLTPVNTDDGWHYIQLQLPDDVICTQCVLQWRYHAGNSWGVDPESGRGCVGCGPQEEFYACSDIKVISAENGSSPVQTSPITVEHSVSSADSSSTANIPGSSITTSSHESSPTTSQPNEAGPCIASGAWEGMPSITDWCNVHCPLNHCPSNMCDCGPTYHLHLDRRVCVAKVGQSAVIFTPWCQDICDLEDYCAESMCDCQ